MYRSLYRDRVKTFHVVRHDSVWSLESVVGIRNLSATCLVGAFSAMLGWSSAHAQQVELVPFRTADDGVVIEIGKGAPRRIAAPTNEAEPTLSPDALASDFAGLVPAPTFVPAVAPAPIERSAIPIPLWMQTGRVSPAGMVVAAAVAPYLYSPAACSISPYRPRGDLPPYLEQRRARYYPLISAVACEAGVPVGLFDALVAQESRYDPFIVSPKGAVGLTQLMPGTASYLGVFDSRDPLQNLRGGARYLREHLDEFKRVDLALAAYNAGPGRVRLNGRIPPFRETIGYVSAITRGWSASAFRTATIQTASLSSNLPTFRGAQLLNYTSTSVANPR
jgi:soluble lytic murein transglycosylase-like protein